MDIYAEITERIISEMEQGIIPWQKPWIGTDSMVSHATGKGYSILNQVLLGKPGEYATFHQIQSEGGKVKKGAKSRIVVFWKILEKESENGKKETIPYLKYMRVFHLDDCEGVSPKYIKETPVYDNKPIERAQDVFESYVNREGLSLEYGEGGAYYRPSADMIHLPLLSSFVSSEAFYDTAFHEAVHSTGHEKRLNRKTLTAGNFFGHNEYSKEELVAEIGACSIIHALGLETAQTFRNNTAYIQNWLKALKDDKRMLVGASSAAEKAVSYIFGKTVEMEV